jgi:DNA primase
MANDPTTTKFVIKAKIHADGVVEKPDIIGAIFGQTEGLLGNEMDMRDLQKSARIGRIEVDIEQKGGKTDGVITIPSALEKVESAIVAAGLETIDRIGPAKAEIKVLSIEDARSNRRDFVRERAKQLLQLINDDPSQDSSKILDEVRGAVQVGAVTHFRGTKLPCGPNVESAESIILVEGRSDVINLLKCGIKNALAVEGTNVPEEVKQLTHEKTTTIFVDGDRGGELIARELLETCEVDFVARAPNTREVEELPHKLVMKCLKNKLSADQFVAQLGLKVKPRGAGRAPESDAAGESNEASRGRDDGGRRRGRRGRRGKGGDRAERGDQDVANEDDDAPRQERPQRTERAARPARRDEPVAERPADTWPADAPKETAGRKAAHDARAGFRDTLDRLSGSLKAVILDTDGNEIKADLPVRELADTLRQARKKVQTVIFDGVITQRLLDIAAEKSIATVVGVKMGNVSKVPDAVEILTKDELN